MGLYEKLLVIWRPTGLDQNIRDLRLKSWMNVEFRLLQYDRSISTRQKSHDHRQELGYSDANVLWEHFP
jgi:hypothetical protein